MAVVDVQRNGVAVLLHSHGIQPICRWQLWLSEGHNDRSEGEQSHQENPPVADSLGRFGILLYLIQKCHL